VSVHTSVDGSSSRPASGLPTGRPVSIHDLAAAKQRGERFVMVTAYDASSGALLDELGVPVILVGDSLGMVVLGYDSTVPVTLDEMLHHTRAVARGARHALVVGDLPFGTYQDGPSQALASATRMLKEGGANAVKLEGGGRMVEVTAHLVGAGIPVMGHLGLTPQSVNQFGGFKVQGRERRPRSAWSPMPSRCRRPVRSRSCSRPSPPRSAGASPRPSRCRRSGSGPAPTPTRRCWSGTTCSG
jgi:hypothetical protein